MIHTNGNYSDGDKRVIKYVCIYMLSTYENIVKLSVVSQNLVKLTSTTVVRVGS